VTELELARVFAAGPRPKRSLVFIWHAAEEFGLYGSKYNADFPVVPLDKVDVQLNIDMIGRDNEDDRTGDYSNAVFLVGDDRISTDLHNLIVDANAAMRKPLTLDYTLNDPADPEQIYYRSDHYSYAAKGIPIAFFTDGLPGDYHCPSDTVDRINFEKMTRTGQLVFQTGLAIANRDRFLVRDNRGPRSGRGFQGKLQ
jgi:Zn-dependent M28 family amino/carboxypeptidase